MGDGFSCNDGTFFQGTDATVGDGLSCNDGTFFQGTDATVGDGFAQWADSVKIHSTAA